MEFFKDEPELDCENNISFGDLIILAKDQELVEIPAGGYDITNPTIFVFFKK